MAKAAPVHYSPKEINELKQIKRDYPRAHTRRKIVQDWATKHNRPFAGVRAKIGSLTVRGTNGHKKPTQTSTPAPAPVANATTNTGLREVRLPIQSWRIENDELVIIY